MSISSVITLGYGQGVNFIPTLGYSSGAAPAPTPDVTLLGGGPGLEHHEYNYVSAYQRQKDQEYLRLKAEEKRAELQRIDDEIAEAEQRQLAARKRAKAKLLAEKAAIKLATLEAQLQDDIRRLRMERVLLMRRIDDEEAILVLLLSTPFH